MAVLSLTNATWVDVNPAFTVNNRPELLPDAQAVMYSGLSNLFGCPIGARGRTFRPRYGSLLIPYLQEPISESTARSMRISMIQSIDLWEPRITLNRGQTTVVPYMTLPGYQIRVAFYMQGSDTLNKLDFDLKV